MITEIIHTVLHLDESLVLWTQNFGPWMYLILFLVIFAETGLIVTPFLPGDSLLFAAGAVCALDGSALEIGIVWGLLVSAAIIGDNVNYWLGREFGARWIETRKIAINKQYLNEAEQFYKDYGLRTVILARFLPIVRTFAPFVAGLAHMKYKSYLSMSVVGSLLWMTVFLGAGYKFANISQVKSNFHLIILAVIFVSFIPIVFKIIKARLASKIS
ncbi:MAG: VTT domain-containing protein [Bdellovibrionales bacterium]|nr:VTT domain-containing protein [Bdellovibrionales bacterium]